MFLIGRPNIGNRTTFNKIVDTIFERTWFTNYGEVVQTLEAKLADYLGVKNCIVACNATIGLQVACQALELSGEVIVPAYTFVATPHSLQWTGIKPIFVDINPSTHLMEPKLVEEAITDKTTAILGVHLWGQACYPEILQSIADRYHLKLYFDAAHAFGCSHNGKMIGNFGECEVFSFHATKFFNTFEGGAITTNNDELAKKIRLMINFGFAGFDHVVELGTNGKMSEIHAAMGVACLEKVEDFIKINKQHYSYYQSQLAPLKGVKLHHYSDVQQNNYQYIVIEIEENIVGKSRDFIVDALHQRGIIARRYFFPGCHRMEPYRSLYPDQINKFSITDSLCKNVLLLPTGAAYHSSQIKEICDAFLEIVLP